MLRIDPAEFGASRAVVLDALAAEGIPCSAGYGYSLPDQPLFRNKAFGPFLPDASARLDYRASRCPNSDVICREQGLWLGQNLLLGTDQDIDDIVRAFEKVHAHRDELTA
jgi:perosamine synthetase